MGGVGVGVMFSNPEDLLVIGSLHISYTVFKHLSSPIIIVSVFVLLMDLQHV